MGMTDEQREAIRARLEAATPGPWARDPYKGANMQVVAHGNEVVAYHGHHQRQKDKNVVPNFIFIAHAPTDIAALLADNDRLRAALSAWGFVFCDIEKMGTAEGANRLVHALMLYDEIFEAAHD